MVILSIPALGLFTIAEKGNRQEVIDRPNRAALWTWGKLTVIADHNYQGFYKINRAVVGKTRAYLGLRGYICDVSEIGYILTTDEGNRLFRADGRPVNKAWAGGLCLYTCITKTAPDTTRVRLTHWREIT